MEVAAVSRTRRCWSWVMRIGFVPKVAGAGKQLKETCWVDKVGILRRIERENYLLCGIVHRLRWCLLPGMVCWP